MVRLEAFEPYFGLVLMLDAIGACADRRRTAKSQRHLQIFKEKRRGPGESDDECQPPLGRDFCDLFE